MLLSKRCDIIMQKIQEITGKKNLSHAEYFTFLGIKRGMWANWRNDEQAKINAELVPPIAEKTGLNPKWLATGYGDPYKAETAISHEPQAEYGNGLDSVIVKVCTIMTSKTVYATALAANVDAFHAAVLQERENSQLQERLENSEGRIEILEEQLKKVVAASHCGHSQEGEVAIGQAG